MLAVHRDARCPALRAEIDRRDVLEAHERLLRGLDDHALELLDIDEAGAGLDIGDGVEAFRLSRRRLVVVGADCERDIVGGNAARRHARRIEPQPHRKGLAAENVGRSDAVDSRHQRLHDARQKIRNPRARQIGAGETDIHDRRRLPGRFQDDRVLRLVRDQVFDLLHLRHDVGHRLARIVIEPDIGGDRAGALDRVRGEIIDAFGCRDRLLDRGRDKALDQIGRGTGIGGRDRDRRVEKPGILPDLEAQHRLQPDQQNEQAHDERQYRPLDKNIGEFHRPRLKTSFRDRPEGEARNP